MASDPVKISELPEASALNDNDLLVLEQDGEAKQLRADKLPASSGIPGPQGEPGVSPTVKVDDIQNGHKVIITDADGKHEFDVMNGENGEPGEQGKPGADGLPGTPAGFGDISAEVDERTGVPDVQVSTSGTNEDLNIHFTFTGLKGETGAAGKDGPQGVQGPDGNPIGTVISFMGAKAPKDYLICNGSVYKISDYPNLAVFFKDQFGSETYFGSNGDGTFAVPDMRNLFLRGYHGQADEKLSGEVGKKQDGTIHQAVSASSNGTQLITSNKTRTANVDNSTLSQGTALFDIDANRTDLENVAAYTARPVNMAVLYCIKAVKSESEKRDDGEVYSTEETRIGTWVDGKPLYRTVIKTTAPSVLNQSVVVAPIIPDLYELVSYSILAYNPGYYYGIAPMLQGGGNVQIQLSAYYNITTGWMIRLETNNYLNCPITIIFQYTKTTDTAAQSVTSTVLPKASGTITRDGIQYDYELPDIVSAASSAVVAFDDVGTNTPDIVSIASNAKNLEIT